MESFVNINSLLELIEADLTQNLSSAEIERIVGCPAEQFGRIFAFIAGMSLPDYIRRRRITVCGLELQSTSSNIVDLAAKYGYDSQAAFSRAFKAFHHITPTQARSKSAVLTIQAPIRFSPQNFQIKRGEKMAILAKVDFIDLPATRIVGIEVVNGGANNPVPALWESIFNQDALAPLPQRLALLPHYIGWMGEYNPETQTFAYIAGFLLPQGTTVPNGFSYRDLPACKIGLATINGSFANGEVFAHSHQMTVEGIQSAGYTPDYTFGWSAEAYPRDLSFDAQEGTIHYICPCK